MKTHAILLFLVLISPIRGFGQTELEKAKSLESNHQYAKAIKILESLHSQFPLDANIELELARAYRNNGQVTQSLPIYTKLSYSDSVNPVAILEYGDILRTESEFKLAKVQYLRYAQYNKALGLQNAAACDYALQELGKSKNCELEYLKERSNQAIVYKDEVITNSKELDKLVLKEAIKANPAAPVLTVKASTSSKKLQEILGTHSLENTNLSFNEDGNQVAYSESGTIHATGSSAEITNRKIFFAEVDDKGNWSSVTEFPYNNPSYSVCYPSLANNGNTLYFSSNMAGGFGSYDLYVSHKIKQQWTSPVNLGAIINTPGNEICPFYKSGDLFFSSDWHKGFGGFDVFRTNQLGLAWSDIQNLGSCVNSASDDYNFILDKNNDGYFNSNRGNSSDGRDICKTSRLLLKSNNPEIQSISSEDVGIKSALLISPQEEVSYQNDNILQSVDDPAIGFLPKEVQSTKLYFVQIAAMSNYTAAAEARLKNYTKYGNVYKTIEGNLTKVRIGGYNNLNEALALMKILRKNGFKDLFVVADIPTEGRCIMIYKSNADFANAPSEPTEGKLKIRVAEFKAPDWFDSSKINDLGKIEHWTKNGWTIIVLGSFNTPSEAITVLDKVRERGFKEAYIVIEENGRLYRQN